MLKKKSKFILLCFSIFLFIPFPYFYEELENKKQIEEYFSVKKEDSKKEDFVGVLEVPKINLKRGFYNLSSKKNHVDKNIQMIETSLMPDVLNSNLILASHSGNSKISFFKNLYKLEIKDMAFIYYNNKKYVYELINIYNEKKDGTITIRRNKKETNLTLITCDKKNKTLQNVYIFKLINVLEESRQ